MMQFKKSTLAVALSAILAVGNAYAAAAVDLSGSPIVPAKFASELLSTNVTLRNASNALDLTGKIGWGVSAGNHLYIRVDLVNGQFAAALIAASLTTNAVDNGNNHTTVVVLSAGGGIGSTSVVFDASDPAGLTLANTFTLAPTDLTLLNPGQDITATVRFYTDSTLAASGGTALATLNGAYTTSGPALTTDITSDTSTALAATNFTGFAASTHAGGPPAGWVALLGTVSTILNPVLKPSSGVAVVAADLATASDLVVTGDFGAATIGISAAAGCGNPTTATLNTGKTTATFTGFAGASLLPAAMYICYTADGPIPAQTVTGVLSFTGQVTPAIVPSASGTVGTIVRDGTELQATLAQIPAGWTSRIALTNTGTVDRTYTTRVLTEGTDTAVLGAGATGTVPAGKILVLDVPSLVTITPADPTSARRRAGIVITVGGPSNTIQGAYQLISPTGAVTNTGMIRPDTN